jgi:hypothetical protein
MFRGCRPPSRRSPPSVTGRTGRAVLSVVAGWTMRRKSLLRCRAASALRWRTTSLPSMRGWFTTPHSTARPHTSAQARYADQLPELEDAGKVQQWDGGDCPRASEVGEHAGALEAQPVHEGPTKDGRDNRPQGQRSGDDPGPGGRQQRADPGTVRDDRLLGHRPGVPAGDSRPPPDPTAHKCQERPNDSAASGCRDGISSCPSSTPSFIGDLPMPTAQQYLLPGSDRQSAPTSPGARIAVCGLGHNDGAGKGG